MKTILKTSWRFIAKLSIIAAIAFSLSGCLLTSPYWNQEFSSHNNKIPLQAWSTSLNAVTFECAQASHGGLYPYWGPTWHHVATVNPVSPGSLDGAGSRVYSAAHHDYLPANCWRLDPANNVWYSAVRAKQGSTDYNVFDISGLECLGRENGKLASWFGWISPGCNLKYSNSNNAIEYVIFYSHN